MAATPDRLRTPRTAPAARQTRSNRDPWEAQLLVAQDHPLRQLALQNDLAMIRHYDAQLTSLEEKLHKLPQEHHRPDYALV